MVSKPKVFGWFTLFWALIVASVALSAPAGEPLPIGPSPRAPVATVRPLAIDLKEVYMPFEPIVVEVIGEATVYVWDWSRSLAVNEGVDPVIEIGDGRTVHVWAPLGEHWLSCIVLTIDWDKRTYHKEFLRAQFTVGDKPDPDPDPDPDPIPDSKAVLGVIVEERDDRGKLTPQQTMIFENKAIRALLAKGFQIRDDDVKDETEAMTPDMKRYIDRARKIGLPAWFLVDKGNVILFEGPLPKDVPETAKIIQKYLKDRS